MRSQKSVGRWLDARRREYWHLRQGGLAQLREHRRRMHAGTPMSRILQPAAPIPDWPLPKRAPRRTLRVGIIADDFTRLSLSYEWHQLVLKPNSWRKQLETNPIDLLFIESAWHGNNDAWQYHLTGASAPLPAVIELVEHCRRDAIPTVFWNKEDPAHFEDFIDTAKLCDWVFTTDVNRIDDYRERLGHDRVGLMAFGVQDLLCNPTFAGPGTHNRGIAFAGTYFAHKFADRREQMTMLFDAALQVADEQHSFDIYSRFMGNDDRYQFPEPYAAHVVGSLSYQQMLAAYRSYKVFLNVNSVTDSPTMCARRVLEITACGTAVVTSPTPAISWYLGDDGAAQVASTDQAERAIRELVEDDEARLRMTHLGQRRLWAEHTFSRRVDDLLGKVGLNQYVTSSPTVSAIISTNRPGQFEHVVDYLAAQRGIKVQALFGAHGWQPTDAQLAQARERGVHLQVVPLEDRWTLGECLNALKQRADGDLVTKMDDDDLYGANYLADLWAAHQFSGADVLGKSGRYVYLQARDVTVYVKGSGQHRFVPFVAGPTLTMTREIAQNVDFQARTTGEDTQYLKDAMAKGASVYATDPFNFVQWRAGDTALHTWQVADAEFGHAIEVSRGVPRDRIMV